MSDDGLESSSDALNQSFLAYSSQKDPPSTKYIEHFDPLMNPHPFHPMGDTTHYWAGASDEILTMTFPAMFCGGCFYCLFIALHWPSLNKENHMQVELIYFSVSCHSHTLHTPYHLKERGGMGLQPNWVPTQLGICIVSCTVRRKGTCCLQTGMFPNMDPIEMLHKLYSFDYIICMALQPKPCQTSVCIPSQFIHLGSQPLNYS